MREAVKPRIFIFDPCFGALTGHWENYCRRLYNELVSRNYIVTIFGQAESKPEIISNTVFVPHFKHLPFLTTRNTLEFEREKNKILSDLERIDINKFQSGDIFIFHSLYPQSFTAIIEWTRKIIKTKSIISTFFFQFPPSDTKEQVGLARKIFYKLRNWYRGEIETRDMRWVDNNAVRYYQRNVANLKPLIDRSHILMASTDVLSQNFSALFDLPVHYLPMPGEFMSAHAGDEVNPINVDFKKPITVGYFGHSSLEKGGQFLRYFVENMEAMRPDVKFILHINPNPDTEAYLKHFENVKYKNTTCYFGHIDTSKMLELMKQVDILLMPYSAKKYATTPSAIFNEGMPLKKVFILPNNTWAYDEAKKYKAGYVAFHTFTQQSIYNALVEATDNFTDLNKKSEIAGKKFYQENNMRNYIDTFERIISQCRTAENRMSA